MEKQKKPVIGVCPLYDETKESIWMLPGYLEGLKEAGSIPVILPLTAERADYETLDAQIDGYLLTGGHDIDPALYGEERNKNCGEPCRMRDMIEPWIYERAVLEDKPVLGICRGIQFINVAEGGTLYQDLPSEYQTGVEHHMCAPYDRAVHEVDIKSDSPLYDLLKKEKLGSMRRHSRKNFRSAEQSGTANIWTGRSRHSVSVQERSDRRHRSIPICATVNSMRS